MPWVERRKAPRRCLPANSHGRTDAASALGEKRANHRGPKSTVVYSISGQILVPGVPSKLEKASTSTHDENVQTS